MLHKLTWEGTFDLKYIILCMIGLDKASIYSPDWPQFIESLCEEKAKA